MERLTIRNSEGVAVLKTPYQCDRCGEDIWRLADYGNGEPIERLAHYEELQERGRLMEFPCNVDSEVWYIDKYGDACTEIVRGVVDGYLWFRTCGFALNVVFDKPIMGHFGYKRKEMPFSEIGKTVFLAKEEAEAALKKMEAQNEVD